MDLQPSRRSNNNSRPRSMDVVRRPAAVAPTQAPKPKPKPQRSEPAAASPAPAAPVAAVSPPRPRRRLRKVFQLVAWLLVMAAVAAALVEVYVHYYG